MVSGGLLRAGPEVACLVDKTPDQKVLPDGRVITQTACPPAHHTF